MQCRRARLELEQLRGLSLIGPLLGLLLMALALVSCGFPGPAAPPPAQPYRPHLPAQGAFHHPPPGRVGFLALQFLRRQRPPPAHRHRFWTPSGPTTMLSSVGLRSPLAPATTTPQAGRPGLLPAFPRSDRAAGHSQFTSNSSPAARLPRPRWKVHLSSPSSLGKWSHWQELRSGGPLRILRDVQLQNHRFAPTPAISLAATSPAPPTSP